MNWRPMTEPPPADSLVLLMLDGTLAGHPEPHVWLWAARYERPTPRSKPRWFYLDPEDVPFDDISCAIAWAAFPTVSKAEAEHWLPVRYCADGFWRKKDVSNA